MNLKNSIPETHTASTGGLRNFNELETQRPIYHRSQACPWSAKVPLEDGHFPKRNSSEDFIFVPVELRSWELGKFALSARLQNVLGWRNCRVLGDLHGLRVSDLAHWRNCGKKTIRELVRLVRNLQEGRWENWRDPHAVGPEDYYEI
jgi:DNA-directed RNA polymerase alpha subunit